MNDEKWWSVKHNGKMRYERQTTKKNLFRVGVVGLDGLYYIISNF